jgi:membrane associated rhomboid family serine protease
VLAVVVPISLAALFLPEGVLLDRLAKDNEAIRAGEWWRLLTLGLVHGSPLHLAMNGIFLHDLGRIVEQVFGPRRMLAILWGGVLAGGLASFLTNPSPSVGISGGLFALVGAMLAQGLHHWRRLAPPARSLFLRAPIEIVILNVALGLALPRIDNAGHLGGLAGGLVLGGLTGLLPEVEAALTGRRPPGAPRGPGPGGASPWRDR